MLMMLLFGACCGQPAQRLRQLMLMMLAPWPTCVRAWTADAHDARAVANLRQGLGS